MKIIQIHYKNNLKLCLWSDFHGVMEFEQAAFLKPYIEHSTELQKQAERQQNQETECQSKKLIYFVNQWKIELTDLM